MSVHLLTIEKIEGYDVTFVKIEASYNTWITAYVRFDNPLNREDYEYPVETYHEGNVYGIDTAHLRNDKMTIEEKIIDAKVQIAEMILIHDGKMVKE